MAIAMLFANAITLILVVIGSKLIPAAPGTNRRIRVIGSRYENTPVAPAATAVGGTA